MIRSVEKDKKKRFGFSNKESLRKILKSISQNLALDSSLRLRAILLLSSIQKKGSIVSIKRRCVVTGRGRFVLGRFNLSRLVFSSLLKKGHLPGFRKASW